MKRVLNYFKEIILDIAYPKHCIVCNKLIPAGQTYCVCDVCYPARHKEKKVIIDEKSGCDEIISPFIYRDNVRKSMLKFKFKRLKYLGMTFATEMTAMLEERKFFNKDIIVVPVPIHPVREREYNQSEVLAQNICKISGIEYTNNLLYKIRPIDRLSGMSYNDKKFFIKNSFHVNSGYNLSGKTVLIVDDIYTSGTTFKELSDALKMRGAKYVYGVTGCYNEKEEE